MAERFRILRDNLAVRKWEPPKKKGSLIIPDTARAQELPRGEVVAIGPMVTSVSVGDVVFLTSAGISISTPIEVDEQDYLVVNERDVICVVEPAPVALA